jgi:uncharacterized repeat protein (TIGR03803 family)
MSKSSLSCAALVGIAAVSASTLVSASSETVLYSFPSESFPDGQVQEDSLGNLYGTTDLEDGSGTVYELKKRRGYWRAKTIHAFGSNSDGAHPTAGLTPDRTDSVFYGTTQLGGANGVGTAFSLVQSGRHWTENVLHHFDDSDGAYPVALLTRDKATGVLYGTTTQGGTDGCGTAFQLNPAGEQFGTLYNFQGGTDGCDPQTQMRPGSKAGTLFGATTAGGAYNGGTLFILTEKAGIWTESVLYTFTGGSDGAFPVDITEPADDPASSIFGVAQDGGSDGWGVVFQLSKPRHKWLYKVIYTFTGGSDGSYPVGLRLDQQTGLLYGTAASGGAANQGVVFRLARVGNYWRETVLHNFSGGSDGANPQSRPLLDPRTGVLYGTTLNGGLYGGGTVYSVTP